MALEASALLCVASFAAGMIAAFFIVDYMMSRRR
jgi:preprotein translocase subunit SecE